ncbi:MAG: DUF1667 domain-containing protein [Oscillospiraceae bacterium]|nr:DUF1667 domain-containing protein [Oscillospiraceae bacterium]
MRKEFICVVCPAGCSLVWDEGEVSGNTCERGFAYAVNEMTMPKRNVSSTVILKGSPLYRRLPVRTSEPIDKALAVAAVRELDGLTAEAPVKIGETVLSNVLGSGVDFVASRSIGR